MKFKVGDIVQFVKNCTLSTGETISESVWRVKKVGEDYYVLLKKDKHLRDIVVVIGHTLADDCCEKINTAPSITKRINDKNNVLNGLANSDAIKPDYYQFHGYDVFDIAEHFGLSFPLGNALKYILRHKDETKRLEDLKKARQCLDRAIELMEGKDNV